MQAPPPHDYADPGTKASTNGLSGGQVPMAHIAPEPHTHVPVHYSGRTGKNIGVFAVVLAVGLAFIFFFVHRAHSSANSELQNASTEAAGRPVPVDVVRVSRAAGQGSLNLPGDARSFYETTIFGRTNGYVSKWTVDIGDHVHANQVLATIETPELDDQLRETKASSEQLKAQANVAATNAQFAKVSFDRWEAAAPEGAVSQQERDEKKAELESANAKLEAAKATVHLGEAQVQRLETLEKFKDVTAPFDGVITERFLDIGSLVTAGSTTNTTPLYTISQSTQMRVFVDVPQPSVADIHVGMTATGTVRELPGEVFVGKVDRTASSLNPKSRTLKVEVLIPNPKLTMLPGMYVQVKFETSGLGTALRIPAAALTFGASGPRVAIVDDDHRLTFHPVTIAKDLGDFVELSTGVSENQMVALNVGAQVSDGEKVDARVIELAAPTQQKAAPAGKAAVAEK